MGPQRILPSPDPSPNVGTTGCRTSELCRRDSVSNWALSFSNFGVAVIMELLENDRLFESVLALLGPASPVWLFHVIPKSEPLHMLFRFLLELLLYVAFTELISSVSTERPGTLSPRGAPLSDLARVSQREILATDQASEGQILRKQIGLDMRRIGCLSASSALIVLGLMQMTLSAALLSWGHVDGGYVLHKCASMFFDVVAFLLTALTFKTFRSPSLNLALKRLDRFVNDCGRGLEWESVARRERKFASVAWTLSVLVYSTSAVMESVHLEHSWQDDHNHNLQQTDCKIN